MKMRNYIKSKEEKQDFDVELLATQQFRFFKVKYLKRAIFAVAIFTIFTICFICNRSDVAVVKLSEESLLKMASVPVAATSTAARGVIEIPTGMLKTNPFVPYREILDSDTSDVVNVPAYTLVEPPESVNEGSEAARVMDTIVSGILYDKFSPSAIINIEGSDYLVKKGDVVNNYEVLNIAQDSVTVKLGVNTYKAGIGEILTEGTLNHNDVSNLNNKFGGTR